MRNIESQCKQEMERKFPHGDKNRDVKIMITKWMHNMQDVQQARSSLAGFLIETTYQTSFCSKIV